MWERSELAQSLGQFSPACRDSGLLALRTDKSSLTSPGDTPVLGAVPASQN